MKLHVWNKLLAATLAILAGAILASVGFLLDYLPTSVLVLVGSLTIAAVAIFFVMALFIALCEKFANASDWRPRPRIVEDDRKLHAITTHYGKTPARFTSRSPVGTSRGGLAVLSGAPDQGDC